ncbi:uncharacterized protein BO80DRAFT_344989 [Aspergillus ibericus CBS 121593]|uniref:AB hydrolase-1 domain-containing protein n=1 Tax=Aspergillus ibericus CBS 121593 TaxID=1448316 RepID=A0A395HDB2_9EURO|nr:hypothetical protein BO80DRAFT_344989 [Aspergillus ibericus CBS 121593]RAL05971.1 hypothetical protein BO80DRAFT_344989 [Aspergillus ibericus CBS 121593]
MPFPTPTYTFSIPSIHDRLRLDCRIYLPSQQQQQEQQLLRGAIIAHPYAPLGGCFDDPVVGFVGGELLKAGLVVGTFNFRRGAGESEGRTSWTARPELADYVSFYVFMLLYLHFRGGRGIQDFNMPGGGRKGSIRIVLGGYSYGSMIASHLPSLDAIVDLLRKSSSETPIHEIYQIADKLSLCLGNDQLSAPRLSPTYRPATVEELGRAADGIGRAAISYLLVSPLLPPVNQFLTLFSKMSLDAGAQTSAQGRQIPCPKPADQLCAHETLAIYGDQDTFTSASKLEKWSAELAHAPESRFQAVEIEGAGHFWREHGVESQAREVIRDWVCQMA